MIEEAIQEGRMAMAAILAAMDNWAVFKRKYNALDLGNNIDDADFDGLTAAEFTTAVSSGDALETELGAGHNTNLYKAAL